MLLIDALRLEQVGERLAMDAEVGIHAAAALEPGGDEQIVVDRTRQFDAAFDVGERIAFGAETALETAAAVVETHGGGRIAGFERVGQMAVGERVAVFVVAVDEIESAM